MLFSKFKPDVIRTSDSYSIILSDTPQRFTHCVKNNKKIYMCILFVNFVVK